MSTFYARPVIPLTLAFALGILSGARVPGYVFVAGGIALIVSGVLIAAALRGQSAGLLPVLLFMALGYAALQPWVQPRFPVNHIIHFADAQAYEIEGVVAKRPRLTDGRQVLVLRIERLAKDAQWRAVSGNVRLTIAGHEPVFQRGDRLRCRSRLRSIRNFNNPGGFDYKRSMAFQRIWATAYVQAQHLRLLERRGHVWWGNPIEHARAHIAGLIAHSGHGPPIGVLTALIVGEREGISPAVRAAFNRAGLGHVLAISGLHIGIIATVAFVFFRWLLASIKPLLWRAWTRKGAAMLALIPVWCYAVLAGMAPSTQRAVIMVSVFLVTFLVEREHDITNTLTLAALVILIVFPPALFSISFQLSFAAVFAILFGFGCLPPPRPDPVKPDLASMGRWLRRQMAALLMVSVFAIAGTLPLVMMYFNQVSIVGIVANVIVVPLVGFAVVPLGLSAAFLAPVCLTWAHWCFQVCGVLLSATLRVVDFFADLPFAAVQTVTPTVLEIACYYVLMGAVGSLLARDPMAFGRAVPRRRAAGQARAPARRRNLAMVAALVAALLLAGDTICWLYARFWHTDLRVTVIDVGHGNAALVELPGGHTMLIDGGGFSDPAAFDIGARVVAPFLWKKKIQRVDTVVLSHPNSDHLNGLIYIAEHFHVGSVWTNQESRDTLGYQKLMQTIAARGIAAPRFADLPRRHMINGVELHILYPPTDFLQQKERQKWRTTNNNSLVLRIALGSKSFLFPGDIMAAAETELVHMADTQLASTVLLAPHHGSKTSSTAAFLDNVAPQVVVISAGVTAAGRFPHPDVLARCRQRGCQLFRTDTHGAVTFRTDGRQLCMTPFIGAN